MYKYTKLTQHLKHLIETGELKPHEKLPSLRDQVKRSGLSLMTVLNAYQELEAQGLIYSVQKSGYFVAPFYPSSRPHANSEIRLNKQVEINSVGVSLSEIHSSYGYCAFGVAFSEPRLSQSAQIATNSKPA